jgi:predicted alternative tryptophan synthase beta-subunit
MTVTLGQVREAAQRISGALERTPCLHSRTLSRLTGAEVWLKFENLQFTASFKERGALNKLLLLGEAGRKRGVIAMSAGNHAQGVAYHATRLGARAVIVMPRGTPNSKLRRARRSPRPRAMRTNSRRAKASPSSIPTTIPLSSPDRARWRWKCSSRRRTSRRWWCRSAAAA